MKHRYQKLCSAEFPEGWGGVRKKERKLLALKVVAVAYWRWSLTRGSKYSDLTWKGLVFWKIGRLSQPEVRLSHKCVSKIFYRAQIPQIPQTPHPA